MPDTSTETVSLNLDGNFASQASTMAAGADKLTASVDKMNAAMGAVKGPNIGGNAPFSGASDLDFRRSRWEGWKPPTPAAAKGPSAPKAGGKPAGGFSVGLGKNLKFVAKQAGISRAALAALGTAALLEGSKLALGYRGMALLQGITLRTSLAIRQLFRGVDPMPLVRAYDSFTRLFSKSSATGVYLTGLFSRIFNSLFGGIEKAEPTAERFFKGMIIGAQQIEIAWLKLRIALVPVTTAIEGIADKFDLMGDAADGGSAAMIALAGYAATAAAPFLATAAAVGTLVKQIGDLKKAVGEGNWIKFIEKASTIGGLGVAGNAGKGIADVITEKTGLIEKTRGLRRFLGTEKDTSPSLYDAQGRIDVPLQPGKGPDVGVTPVGASGKASGAAYGDGVAAGMRSRVGDVTAAGGDLAGSADTGFRKAAQINSPSRMAYDTASWIPAGIVDAFDDGRSDVQAAANRLSPEMPGASGGGAASAGARAGGAAQVTVQHIWPAGVERANRREIEDAAFAGTMRAMAVSLGVPVTP